MGAGRSSRATGLPFLLSSILSFMFFAPSADHGSAHLGQHHRSLRGTTDQPMDLLSSGKPFDPEEAIADFIRDSVRGHNHSAALPSPRTQGPRDCTVRSATAGAASFNDKVQWRMQHDRRAIWAVLADKFLTRVFVTERDADVRLAPLLYHGGCSSLPSLDSLPEDFAFKATHTSGCNLLIRGGRVTGQRRCASEPDLMGKRPDSRTMQELCERWTAAKYSRSSNEWAYSMLSPAVLMEELVYGASGKEERGGSDRSVTSTSTGTSGVQMNLPRDESAFVVDKAGAVKGGDEGNRRPLADDIKCFSFNGHTAFFQHVESRFGGMLAKRDSFYRRDGLAMNVSLDWSHYNRAHSHFPRPQRARDIIAICDRLSQGFDFARVDLLDAGDGAPVLGEITPYPGGGRHWFWPLSFNHLLSSFWCLPV